jgi:uncharacterized protein
MSRTKKVRSTFGAMIASFLLPALSLSQTQKQPAWRADHHVHVSSPDLCKRIGGCLESNQRPAVFASDAIAAMDKANVSRGVVLSCAYLYAMSSVGLAPSQITQKVREENQFTAAEVAKFPSRLVGFLSVDPFQDSAVEEIRFWAKRGGLIGVKMHFSVAKVHLNRKDERTKVARVVTEAARHQMPMVIHLGSPTFSPRDAEIFIREILPLARGISIQIAHAGGGGYPVIKARHQRILRIFADHIAKHDPATQNVWFDLSFVPAPDETEKDAMELRREIRRIGISRFVFGSDYNEDTPQHQIENLQRLGLVPAELETIRTNCTPWACSTRP